MQSKSKTGPTPFPPLAPADQYEATFWQQWRAQLRLLVQQPWLATTWLKQSRLLLERFNHIYGQLCRQPRPVRRRLQRRLGATLTGVALALSLANLPVQAADFTASDATTLIAAINAANDETTYPGPDTITLTSDVTLTLASYEGDAFDNALPPITSAITIEGNGFTIARDAEDSFGFFAVFDPGNLTLNQTTLTGALGYVGGVILNYDGVVTINQSTVSGNMGFVGGAIVNLTSAATLAIHDSVLTGNDGLKYGSALTNAGTATLTNSTVENNTNKYLGGSLVNLAMLTITDSTITNNTSNYGSGGGILNQEGELTITGSAITNNTATGTEAGGGLGGGLYNVNGNVTLTDSTISGNSSGFSGGGLFNYAAYQPDTRTARPRMPSPKPTAAVAKLQQLGIDATRLKAMQTVVAKLKAQATARVQAQAADTATMTLVNSTVSDNTAGTNTETARMNDDEGGGIVNAGGTLHLTNSTVSGNQAPNNDGDFAGVGGGIFNAYDSTLTLHNSTVTGNSAGYVAGGIFNQGESTLERSLIAGNSASSGSNELLNYVGCMGAATTATPTCLADAATVTADAFNLFGHSGESNADAFYGFTPGATDMTATNNGTTPTALAGILNPSLADNGGDTFTHALVMGSPALDAAGDSGLATDQRGVTRPQGAADDIGAFEQAVTSASPLNLIYISSHSNGTIDGVPYRDEDILLYNTVTKQWSLFFDGSDVGVGNADLDAFTLLADGTILMSFDKGLQFPTLGLVSDADIVKFTPTQMGVNTSGSFTLFFAGSAVELTTGGEDIDAVGYTSDGKLLISVGGSARVGALRAQDEDLLQFTPTSLGATTAGAWELYFDGSAVGLTAGSEDIGAATVDSLGQLYLVTKGNFRAASQNSTAGDGDDIFGCLLGATGENTTSCTFFAFFDGDLVRFKQLIDGLSLGSAPVTSLAVAETTAIVGNPVQFAIVPDAVVADDTEYDEFDLPAEEEGTEPNTRIYLPLISD